MPKQRNQKQKTLEYNSLDQLEIAAADSSFALFCENKKLTEPMSVQIGVLKRFFEIYKKNTGYESMDEIEIGLFDDKQITQFLTKILNLSCPKDSKNQKLIKLDQKLLLPVILLSKLQSLISSLDDKQYYDITCKKIFAILDRILPYYPINIRDSFCLISVFSELENLRVIFFKILNEILSTAPKSFLFEQIQIHALSAILFWVSHSKSKNFFLIIDVLQILEKYTLESLMVNDLTENQVFFLLPSPLRIIDCLTKYFEIEVLSDKKNSKLQVLNNIKTSFLEFQEKNYLQISLKSDFIFFIDCALDFALTSNTKHRTFILTHYDSYRPLIKKIFLSYDGSSMSDEALAMSNFILDMMKKWQSCIQTNLQDFDKSEQTGLALSEREALEIDVHNKALLEQALHAPPSKKTIQDAQQFVKKELKRAEEEAFEIKKSKAVKLAQSCSIDQYQNKLIEKFSIISDSKKSEQELFNSKEQIILKEITKYLGITPTEKLLDKDLLDGQEKRLFHLANEVQEDDLHTLLLLYINLLDIFLSRIKYKMKIYKKQYASAIEQMFNRHGKKDFTKKDHKLNKLIKENTPLILDNLTATNDYCQCILKIFHIITLLRPNIKDIEFYKIWNLPIDFRKHEYENNYKNALENLEQFLDYREHKKTNFDLLKIPVNKNKKCNYEINEKEISNKLKNLLDSIKEITSRINENGPLSHQFSKVFLAKQTQARQQEIQNTVIESNKIRVPIDYNPSEVLRRSQSYTDFYTKPSIFSLIENNLFFNPISKLDINIEENVSCNFNKYNRRMSL